MGPRRLGEVRLPAGPADRIRRDRAARPGPRDLVGGDRGLPRGRRLLRADDAPVPLRQAGAGTSPAAGCWSGPRGCRTCGSPRSGRSPRTPPPRTCPCEHCRCPPSETGRPSRSRERRGETRGHEPRGAPRVRRGVDEPGLRPRATGGGLRPGERAPHGPQEPGRVLDRHEPLSVQHRPRRARVHARPLGRAHPPDAHGRHPAELLARRAVVDPTREGGHPDDGGEPSAVRSPLRARQRRARVARRHPLRDHQRVDRRVRGAGAVRVPRLGRLRDGGQADRSRVRLRALRAPGLPGTRDGRPRPAVLLGRPRRDLHRRPPRGPPGSRPGRQPRRWGRPVEHPVGDRDHPRHRDRRSRRLPDRGRRLSALPPERHARARHRRNGALVGGRLRTPPRRSSASSWRRRRTRTSSSTRSAASGP